MITVGQVREAIALLADDAPVVLHILVSNAAPDDTIISLEDITSADGRLIVGLYVEGDEEDLEDIDGELDDEEAS